VARVGGYPVTEEELKRFRARMGAREGNHGQKDEKSRKELVDEFARYWVVVTLGNEQGLGASKRLRDLEAIYEMAMYAGDYRRQLPSVIEIQEKEFLSLLPSRWLRMDFGIKGFVSDRESLEAFDSYRKGVVWESLRGTRGLSPTDEDAKTGWVFPGSGFFRDEEELVLFQLKAGEVYGPVVTGVGPALVKVLARDEMTAEAIAAYRKEARGRLANELAEKEIAAAVGAVGTHVEPSAVAEGIRAEMKTGDLLGVPVATFDGGQTLLDYSGFRRAYPQNYKVVLANAPEEAWGRLVVGDVENVARLYELGKLAKAKNFALNPKWRTEAYDFRNLLVYEETLKRLFEEYHKEPTPEEVSISLKERPELLVTPRKASIRYLYAPKKELLEEAILKAGGKPVDVFSSDQLSKIIKEVVITSDSKVWGDVYSRISSLKSGETSDIVESKIGYYVIQLLSRTSEGNADQELVREFARRKLGTEKAQRLVRKLLEERLLTMPVEYIGG